MSWLFITSLAIFADETTRVCLWPSFRSIRGPYLLERAAMDWCGRAPSWWRLPMMGSLGGEGGKLGLLRLKSFSRSMKKNRRQREI